MGRHIYFLNATHMFMHSSVYPRLDASARFDAGSSGRNTF